MDLEATRMATENENTMPRFANVRIMPDAMPNMSGGAAFMMAELLAEKNGHAPTALNRADADDPPQRCAVAELRVQHKRDDVEGEPGRRGPHGAVLVRQPAGVNADRGGDQVAG